MSLNINKNFAAIANNALTSMGTRQTAMGKAISRVSTGMRVNSPVDDASAYRTSRLIQADATGYTALANGVQTSSAKLNAADSAISSVLDVLNAMKAKALEYSAASGDSSAQTTINSEFKNLAKVLDSALNFKYNDQKILDGDGTSVNAYTTIFTGTTVMNAVASTTGVISASWADIEGKITTEITKDKGVTSLQSGMTVANSATIVTRLSDAIKNIVTEQGNIASALGAMEYASVFLSNAANTQETAYMSITEADMAREMTSYVKNNVYAQAAQAMIAQANQSMASVLNLLQ